MNCLNLKKKTLINQFLIFPGLISFVVCACQSNAVVENTKAAATTATSGAVAATDVISDPKESTKLTEMTCEQLLAKAKDSKFVLRALAGIRARKKCKQDKIDFNVEQLPALSDFEKRIYSEELEELDAQRTQPSSSLSIAELKANLKAALKPEEKVKAFKQLRARQKNLGNRNEYLRTTIEFFNWARADWKLNQKSTEAIARFYEATLLLARSYWTEGRSDTAERILSGSLRTLKGITSVAEIYFLKGRMADEAAHYEEALSNYELAQEDIKQLAPKSLSFSNDRLLWIKAWLLYKEKKWASAEKAFGELATSTTDTSERSRSLFFQARCLTQLEKKDEAKLTFERIIKDDFFSFYGLVTYNELGIKFPALSQLKFEKKFPFDPKLSFLNELERSIFVELIQYQEINIAERAVLFLAKGLDKQVNLGIYLAEKGKRFLPLFAAFAKLENNDRLEVLVNYPDLLFPQPYLENVKKMSEKTLLPTSLIYSIMKQESAFNERTRSSADAIGLMQMIPRLAKSISKKFTVDYKKPEDLYNPDINIQLGSLELMEQVRKQFGQLTYVAAAYNAGPNALAGWLKNRKRNDIVEFIEEIPYDETRTYVKIIARNKLFYERVSKRDEEHTFPTEFLTFPVHDQTSNR